MKSSTFDDTIEGNRMNDFKVEVLRVKKGQHLALKGHKKYVFRSHFTFSRSTLKKNR